MYSLMYLRETRVLIHGCLSLMSPMQAYSLITFNILVKIKVLSYIPEKVEAEGPLAKTGTMDAVWPTVENLTLGRIFLILPLGIVKPPVS